MSNTYIGRSLIYWNREQSIRLGYWKWQRETQNAMYMNGRHRNAESDRNKRRDLTIIRDRVRADIFCDPEDLETV